MLQKKVLFLLVVLFFCKGSFFSFSDKCFQQDQTLNEYNDDEAFRYGWNIFYNTVYIVDGFVGGYQILNSLSNFCTAVRNAKYLENSEKLMSQGFFTKLKGLWNAGNDLETAWINGWTKEQVLAIPKGSRPSPSTYLKQSYIDAHLTKFNQEGIASRLVFKDDYLTYGIGKPDVGMTEFVGLKSEIDEILLLPLEQQATRLGVPIDQLDGGELVRIDFNLTPTRRVEMPSDMNLVQIVNGYREENDRLEIMKL